MVQSKAASAGLLTFVEQWRVALGFWLGIWASRGTRRRNRSGNSIVGIARGTSNKLAAHRGFSSRKPSVQNCSPRWLANTNRNDRSRRLEGNMELTFNRGVSHGAACLPVKVAHAFVGVHNEHFLHNRSRGRGDHSCRILGSAPLNSAF
jgi:hypothetical protein